MGDGQSGVSGHLVVSHVMVASKPELEYVTVLLLMNMAKHAPEVDRRQDHVKTLHVQVGETHIYININIVLCIYQCIYFTWAMVNINNFKSTL